MIKTLLKIRGTGNADHGYFTVSKWTYYIFILLFK